MVGNEPSRTRHWIYVLAVLINTNKINDENNPSNGNIRFIWSEEGTFEN